MQDDQAPAPPAEDQPAQELETTKRSGRATRPDGSFYSSDPSERMAQLRDDGRVGPQFGILGGRPRKPRAGEQIAEYARKNAKKIETVFDELLGSDTEKVRLAAAKEVLNVERKEADLQLDEERLLREMPREQLEEELISALNDPMIRAALSAPDSDEFDDDDLSSDA